jgi:hypothetical protein
VLSDVLLIVDVVLCIFKKLMFIPPFSIILELRKARAKSNRVCLESTALTKFFLVLRIRVRYLMFKCISCILQINFFRTKFQFW